MQQTYSNGFSLVEILISLFIVSLTAVNISGLQKMVGDQSRNNFSHSIVIKLVSEKLEEIRHYSDLQSVLALNGTHSEESERGTKFNIAWHISTVNDVASISPIREVAMTVTWLDATLRLQKFTFSEQISFLMILENNREESGSRYPYIIPNLLGTDTVSYFEPEVDYHQGAYVIYDSQLFQANADNHIIPMSSEQQLSEYWDNLGLINNPDLANLFSN